MGENLGHISLIKVVSDAARKAGAKVTFILPDLKKAEYLQLDINDLLFQAPTNVFAKARSKTAPSTLTEGLLLSGYSQVNHLSYAIRAWRALLTQLMPTHIIYDFAPTAKLASQDLNCIKIAMGSPYCVYPDNIQGIDLLGHTVKSARVENSDQQCLNAINQALTLNQLNKVISLEILGKYDFKYILGTTELDGFKKHRLNEQYVGFLKPCIPGRPFKWPGSTHKPKVFAYLSTVYPFARELVKELKLASRCVIYLIGKNTRTFLDLADEQCIITGQPVDIDHVLSSSDGIIHHGGFNLIGQTLLSQTPSLCIPLHAEQQANTQQLSATMLGQTLSPKNTWEAQKPVVHRFLESLNSNIATVRNSNIYKAFDATDLINTLSHQHKN